MVYEKAFELYTWQHLTKINYTSLIENKGCKIKCSVWYQFHDKIKFKST